MDRKERIAKITEELQSEEYQAEYDRHLDILNSLSFALIFISLNCSRSKDLSNSLFCLSVIDDMLQSLVAIKCLSKEGLRNVCRRELRYLIELAIKACLVSQQFSDKSSEDQIEQFRDTLRTTNISMIKEINFHFFDESQKEQFISDTKRMYKHLCQYVHSTPYQLFERVELNKKGRYVGFEGTNELQEFNDELGKALVYVLVLFFHAIPVWCVGDYIVESDGSTVATYFSKFYYFAIIDKYFDYKNERSDKLQQIQKLRNSKICYGS